MGASWDLRWGLKGFNTLIDAMCHRLGTIDQDIMATWTKRLVTRTRARFCHAATLAIRFALTILRGIRG